MTTRLQVRLDADELVEIKLEARRRHMTVSAWVREALRKAIVRDSDADIRRRLAAIEHAATYSFPTADIDQMLHEIES